MKDYRHERFQTLYILFSAQIEKWLLCSIAVLFALLVAVQLLFSL
ncbi:MAG TPA: hypothetical protein VF260_10510 [Bacilli bacterium]